MHSAPARRHRPFTGDPSDRCGCDAERVRRGVSHRREDGCPGRPGNAALAARRIASGGYRPNDRTKGKWVVRSGVARTAGSPTITFGIRSIAMRVCPPRLSRRGRMDREGERWAVLIGANHGAQTPHLPPLRYAENDASDLWEVLVDENVGTFDRRNSFLITGSNATVPTIKATLRRIALTARAADVLLVFFAGHAVV